MLLPGRHSGNHGSYLRAAKGIFLSRGPPPLEALLRLPLTQQSQVLMESIRPTTSMTPSLYLFLCPLTLPAKSAPGAFAVAVPFTLYSSPLPDLGGATLPHPFIVTPNPAFYPCSSKRPCKTTAVSTPLHVGLMRSGLSHVLSHDSAPRTKHSAQQRLGGLLSEWSPGPQQG